MMRAASALSLFFLVFTVACGNDSPPNVNLGDGGSDALTTTDGALDPCASGCLSPPAKRCVDGETLRTYEESGRCDEGACHYAYSDQICPEGCEDDACVGDPCLGVSCNQPAESHCEDGALLVYEAHGRCVEGECHYTSTTVPCEQGCAEAACIGDPCAGVTCNTPPAPRCSDASTLESYASQGTCNAGHCDYATQPVTCPYGCDAGACKGDPCAGKSCTAPPADYCFSATTLRTFPNPGSCSGGSCLYPPKDQTCPYGCDAGACKGDPCAGKTCTTPPAAYCVDTETLRSFESEGSCVGGGCVYDPQDTPCLHGCQGGRCKSDPCVGVSCDAPPASGCVDGSTLRSYAPTGLCVDGQCQYPYSDQFCSDGCSGSQCAGPVCGSTTCASPPAPFCDSSQLLKTYAPIGRCDAGSCDYQEITIACSEGCFDGACIAGSHTIETIPLPALDSVRLEVDAAGQSHLLGCEAGDLIYRHKTPSGWVDETVDVGLGGCNAAMALTSSGQALFVYQDVTNKDVRFARRVGPDSFAKELVATTGDVGSAVGIVADAADTPILVYTDTTNLRTIVATRTAQGFSNATLDVIPGGKVLVAQLRFDSAGRLHLVMGDRVSHARSSGGYDQPTATYARRSVAGVWSHEVLHEDAMLSYHPMAIGANDEVQILYGEVSSLGASDAVHLARVAADGSRTDAKLWSISNLLYDKPIALLDSFGPIKVVFDDLDMAYRQNALALWERLVFPSTLQIGYGWDGMTGADRRGRLLINSHYGYDRHAIYAFPSCLAQCDGRNCGGDGCGGSCGQCATGSSCSPTGSCGAWAYETIEGASYDEPQTLQFDDQGVGHGLFGSASSGKYFRYENGEWSVRTVPAGSYATAQSLAVGEGAPHISALSGGLIVNTLGATSWEPTAIATAYTPTGSHAPLVIDGSGNFHLLHTHVGYNDGGSYSAGYLDYVVYDGQDATSSIVAAPVNADDWDRGGGSAANYALAIDAAGAAHVIWEQSLSYTQMTSLEYATNESGSWQTTTIVPHPYQTVYGPTKPQVFVDSQDVVHVCYWDNADKEVVHAELGASGWEKETASDGSYYFHCTLDPADHPALITGNTLRVKGSGGWTSEVLPTYKDVSGKPLISYDPAGHPHVIYRLSTSGGNVLRHAWR